MEGQHKINNCSGGYQGCIQELERMGAHSSLEKLREEVTISLVRGEVEDIVQSILHNNSRMENTILGKKINM